MFAGYSLAVVKIEYLYTDTGNGEVCVQQRTIDGLCIDEKEAQELIEKLESLEEGWTERQILSI